MWLFYLITSVLPLRTLLLLSASVWLLNFVLNFLKSLYNKVQLINKLPGPRVNPFLGNIPLEVVKHIGSNFDSSKDLYYSKYFFSLSPLLSGLSSFLVFVDPLFAPMSILRVFTYNFFSFRPDAITSWLYPCLCEGTNLSTLGWSRAMVDIVETGIN